MSGRVGTSWKGPRQLRNNNADRVTLTTIGQGVLLLAFAWVMVVLMFMAGAAWGLA